MAVSPAAPRPPSTTSRRLMSKDDALIGASFAGDLQRRQGACHQRRFTDVASALAYAQFLRQEVDQCAHLGRGARTRREHGVHLDRRELVALQHRHQRARLDLGAGHHRRRHRDAEPRQHAREHAGTGIGGDAAADIDRGLRAVARERPGGTAEQAGAEDAVVRREVRRRLRCAALGKIGWRCDDESATRSQACVRRSRNRRAGRGEWRRRCLPRRGSAVRRRRTARRASSGCALRNFGRRGMMFRVP